MAGLGYKIFNANDILTAFDVNGYLMQGVLVFDSAAARSSAIATASEGMVSYLKDANELSYYDSSSWSPVGNPINSLLLIGA